MAIQAAESTQTELFLIALRSVINFHIPDFLYNNFLYNKYNIIPRAGRFFYYVQQLAVPEPTVLECLVSLMS